MSLKKDNMGSSPGRLVHVTVPGSSGPESQKGSEEV
jgi:hypothetical protein